MRNQIQRLDDSFVEGTEEEYDTGEIEELEEDNDSQEDDNKDEEEADA